MDSRRRALQSFVRPFVRHKQHRFISITSSFHSNCDSLLPKHACLKTRYHPSGHRLQRGSVSPLVISPRLSSLFSSSAHEIVVPPAVEDAQRLLDEIESSSHSLYEKLVRRLYMTNLFHPAKMGLENTERLHEALGSPIDNPNIDVVHVAGTNGKGSVAVKIAKTLELTGRKVGMFVSPHISSFRERMQVNSVPISEAEVEELLPRVFSACEEHDIPATFFEVTTILAFLFYESKGANVVVLETGLGGRLDATNILRQPALSIITSIGLEHTRILGDTIEEIAREKAGIMKPGRPVLIGPHVPHQVMRACAAEKNASAYLTLDSVLGSSTVNETADYDVENAQMATAALRLLLRTGNDDRTQPLLSSHDNKQFIPLTETLIQQGTSQRPPCRFEQVSVPVEGTDAAVEVVLDVGHNPPALQHLVNKLQLSYPERRMRFVAGFSNDKDLTQCVETLLSCVGGDASRLHFVEASHPRAASVESIVEAAPRAIRPTLEWNDQKDRSVIPAVRQALQIAAESYQQDQEEGDVLVVCGSVFLMADAREALGVWKDEPRDSPYIAAVAGINLRSSQENFGNVNPDGKQEATVHEGSK